MIYHRIELAVREIQDSGKVTVKAEFSIRSDDKNIAATAAHAVLDTWEHDADAATDMAAAMLRLQLPDQPDDES